MSTPPPAATTRDARTQLIPPVRPRRRHPILYDRLGVLQVFALALPLSLIMVLLGGYQLGVGNQSIQVAFLQRFHNPALFPHDAMVNQTIADYPSYFFLFLAPMLRYAPVEPLYLALHLFTAVLLVASLLVLGRAMFGSIWTGLILTIILIAGHHRPLAGEELYSPGFTHTFAVFPLALFALAFFYRQRFIPAFVLAGIIFNLHALTAAYLAVLMVIALPFLLRGHRWWVAPFALVLFLVAAAPTLILMAMHRFEFTDLWLNLTYDRSADHVLPSAWWQTGHAEVPRFLLIAVLGLLAMSYLAPERQQKTTWLLLIGGAAIFLVGYIGGELHPVSTILRAQLFRASKVLLVILMAHIANAIVLGWRVRHNTNVPLRPHTIALEMTFAVITLLVLAFPPLLPLLPAAVLLNIVVALVNSRMSWWQSVASVAALAVCLAAWRSIHFPLVELHTQTVVTYIRAAAVGHGGALLAGVLLMAVVVALWRFRVVRWPLAVVSAVAYVLVASTAFPAMARDDASRPWADVQLWARDHTPVDALFLTPTQPGGFRVHSLRSVVGEWRDGTQLFFTSSFAQPWWDTMQALQPDMLYDAKGRRISAGRFLTELSDEDLITLAERYHATHIVLPSADTRSLTRVYDNGGYAVYLPQVPPPAAPPPDVNSPEIWEAQQKFLREVAYPNIDKYRKSNIQVQIVDPEGRPVQDLAYTLRETKQEFLFGCSLPFFRETPDRPPGDGDFKPKIVDPRELARFLEVFNFSMIPYSAKWMYLEPTQGDKHYEDLDAYVAWCTEHGVAMEFHFVSGFPPAWMREHGRPGTRVNAEEKGKWLLEHAKDVVERYHDRIRYWQVVNEDYFIGQSPPVFEYIRAKYPELVLGVSHCSRFDLEPAPNRRRGPDRQGTDRQGPMTHEQWLRNVCVGLQEAVRLQERKDGPVKLDFFGFHAHRPFGLWPDARDVYEVFDQYAKHGLKVHITEFGVPDMSAERAKEVAKEKGRSDQAAIGGVAGKVRSGVWTPRLQAEFYRFFYTVCFSHPAVEAVNLFGIGPDTWIPGAGLLDEDYEPKASFYVLRDLIQKEWKTQQSGKLPLEGAVKVRGFHGRYVLELTGRDARVIRYEFDVPSTSPEVKVKLRYDAATGKLERI